MVGAVFFSVVRTRIYVLLWWLSGCRLKLLPRKISGSLLA